MSTMRVISALTLLGLLAACSTGYSGSSGMDRNAAVGTNASLPPANPGLSSTYQHELRAENSD